MVPKKVAFTPQGSQYLLLLFLSPPRGSLICVSSSHGLHTAVPEPKSVPHTSLVLGSLSYEGVSTYVWGEDLSEEKGFKRTLKV